VFSAAASYILSYLLYPQKILVENYWLIFGFMAIVTLIVYYLSDLGLKKGGENQTFVLLAAITIRLIFTLFFLLFFTQKTKVESLLFIFNFFSIYLLFTTFEIYCLLRNLRHQIKK
jgi:amino acid transporter